MDASVAAECNPVSMRRAVNYKQCLVRKASKERDPFYIDFTCTALKGKKYFSPWLQLQTMRIVTRTETLFFNDIDLVAASTLSVFNEYYHYTVTHGRAERFE